MYRSVLLALALIASFPAYAQMSLALDATDIARGRITAHMEFQIDGDDFALRYPQWVQGIHAPGGPVGNVAGLVLTTSDGDAIPWERDPYDLYRFIPELPAGASTLRVSLTYLCNQPSVNSRGVDCFGNASLGSINWNTVALYPDGADCRELIVSPAISLPEGWDLATALPGMNRDDDTASFSDIAFTELLDSPVILGEHMRSITLAAADMPPAFLHLVSESEGALQISDELIDQYTRVVEEGGAAFGGAPFDEYHFLVTCSDQIGGMGLEHLRSSLNGVGERDLLDEKQLRGWVGYLLPHELVHAWVGKYRRPDGMTAPDLDTPLDTSLLWVYEGLTQYVGLVLCARSGLWTPEHFTEKFARDLTWMMQSSGREWRNLEDTARASHTLRGRSPHWSGMRRGQDYYTEGALWWMEADAIIRAESDGKKSLDDFCQAFFGPGNGDAPVNPFSRDELYAALNEVLEYDWRDFFYFRVNRVHENLPGEFANRLGFEVQYANKPTTALTEAEEIYNFIDESSALGASFSNDGVIRSSLTPGMPLEAAGLAPGARVVAVNNQAFTKERLRDAIDDSVTTRGFDFLVRDGDAFSTHHIEYDGGPKYLTLVRDTDRPDILGDILKPRLASK